MPDTVIKIESLGKKYRISHQRMQKYLTFREVVMDRAKWLGKRVIQPFAAENPHFPDAGDFWALKDVSFEVKQGERVGVIGRNGAGKSTLLKILSRITEPSTGRVSIKGRIASLLEVGTGFHPELTGRENIFLNGAILGMSKAEIKKNFDAIVDFAGVGQFLDTPVKHYSSGMYVRLAFAVAAHLDTEILLVDEVLAVGDAEFQKKCTGKMDEVSHKEGRTILFVSHNMPMVASLCESGIWLERGAIRAKDMIAPLVMKYSNQGKSGACSVQFAQGECGDEDAELIGVSVENAQGTSCRELRITEPIFLKMKYRLKKDNLSINAQFHFHNAEGEFIFPTLDTGCDFGGSLKAQKGEYVSCCRIPANFLNDGYYSITPILVTLSPITVHCIAHNILSFLVIDDMELTPTRGVYKGPYPGAIRPLLNWTLQKC